LARVAAEKLSAGGQLARVENCFCCETVTEVCVEFAESDSVARASAVAIVCKILETFGNGVSESWCDYVF
jgi:hypothetical protein